MRIDHGKRFINGNVYINGIEELWSFAKERLMKYHNVNEVKFPLYLKNWNSANNKNRYNNLYLTVVNSTLYFGILW